MNQRSDIAYVCRGASPLYYTPSVIRMMKSREARWTGRVIRLGNIRNAFILFCSGNVEDNLVDIGVAERVILKWIMKEQGWRMWTGFVCLRSNSCGCSIEPRIS